MYVLILVLSWSDMWVSWSDMWFAQWAKNLCLSYAKISLERGLRFLDSYCISAQRCWFSKPKICLSRCQPISTSVISSLFAEKPPPPQHTFCPRSLYYSLSIHISLRALFKCIIITDLYVVLSLNHEIFEIFVNLTAPESNTVSGKQWTLKNYNSINFYSIGRKSPQ